MDKSKLAIAGAVSALLSAGQAASAALPADPAPPAQSFAELLTPIPRALERLPIAHAIDAARADDGGGAEPLVIDGVLRGAPPALAAADGDADANLVLVSQRAGRSHLHRRLPLHRRHIVARHHRQTT